jgi:hypothetical protein
VNETVSYIHIPYIYIKRLDLRCRNPDVCMMYYIIWCGVLIICRYLAFSHLLLNFVRMLVVSQSLLGVALWATLVIHNHFFPPLGRLKQFGVRVGRANTSMKISHFYVSFSFNRIVSFNVLGR